MTDTSEENEGKSFFKLFIWKMTLFGSRKVSAGNGGSGGHAYAYSFGGGGDAKGGGYRWSKIKLIEFCNLN